MKETSDYKGIPAMTSPQVHAYLKELGANEWNGGSVIELGCWLGGSSAPLLEGLKSVGYNKPFWAGDRWRVTKGQIPKAKEHNIDLQIGQDILPIYLKNVSSIYPNIKPLRGALPGSLWGYYGDDIDICIFDAPKQDPIFIQCVKILSRYWVPGQTVLGLLDYKFYERHEGQKRELFKAPVEFIEKNKHCFSVMKEWDDEGVVFFRYEKPLISL